MSDNIDARTLSQNLPEALNELERNRTEVERLTEEMRTAIDEFLGRREVLISGVKVIGTDLKEKEGSSRNVRLIGTSVSALGHGTTAGVCLFSLAGFTVPFSAPILLGAGLVGATGQVAKVSAEVYIEIKTSKAFVEVREKLEEEHSARRELRRTLRRIEQLVRRNEWLLSLWQPVMDAIQEEKDYIQNADWLNAVNTYHRMVALQEELEQEIDWRDFVSKHVENIEMKTLLKAGVLLGRIPVGIYTAKIAEDLKSAKLPKTGLTTLAKVEIGFALFFSYLGLCFDIMDLRDIMTEFKTTGNGEKIIQLADELEDMEADFKIRYAVEVEG